MDDMDAFERQLSQEFGNIMGPVRPVDDAAIFQALPATRSPKWRVRPMISSTRIVIGGAAVAIVGLMLAGMPSRLPTDVAPAGSSVPSPSAGLVYTLDGDIYLANEDGSDPVRIVTRGPDPECDGFGDPYVSPDGRHIASRSGGAEDCPSMVSVFDLDGRLVTSVPGDGWDIAWAPDGSRFATWIRLWETIGVYGIDGTLEAELPFRAVMGDHDPRWTSDGTALLVPTGATVARLPLDGGRTEFLLARDPGSNFAAALSPDGGRAAYTLRGPWPWDLPVDSAAKPARAQLVIEAMDGAEPPTVFELEPGEQVETGWERRPLWSPLGDRIAYVASRYSADAEGELVQEWTQLRVVDATTGQATTMADLAGQVSLWPVAFSADGERILVQAFDADHEPSLWTVAADGSVSTVIAPPGAEGMWVPYTRSGDDTGAH